MELETVLLLDPVLLLDQVVVLLLAVAPESSQIQVRTRKVGPSVVLHVDRDWEKLQNLIQLQGAQDIPCTIVPRPALRIHQHEDLLHVVVVMWSVVVVMLQMIVVVVGEVVVAVACASHGSRQLEPQRS